MQGVQADALVVSWTDFTVFSKFFRFVGTTERPDMQLHFQLLHRKINMKVFGQAGGTALFFVRYPVFILAQCIKYTNNK